MWERVIERRIRQETVIRENQFGFMLGRSTTTAIHVLRRLKEKYREWKKDLQMVSINLENAYDSIPRRIIWDSFKARGILPRYIEAIWDMYDRASVNIHTPVGMTEPFPVKVGLHQEPALSPFIFTVNVEENFKSIWETVPWWMLFGDDIVLVVETKKEVNSKLEEWREVFKDKGLCVSRTKTEYLHCDFSGTASIGETKVSIDEKVVTSTTKYGYLRSTIQSNGDIDGDVTHQIQAGWLKWRAATGVLC